MRTEMTSWKDLLFIACLWAMLGAFFLGLVSCGKDGQGTGAECQIGSDCPDGENCYFGECVPNEEGSDTIDRNLLDTDTGTHSTKDTDTQTDSSLASDSEDPCGDPIADCPDDGNPCTAYVCNAGECELRIRDGESCQTDTNACTAEICIDDTCTPFPLDSVPCEFDDNECTRDICFEGVCTPTEQDGAPCNFDSNPCTEDICQEGVCTGIPISGTPCIFDDEECTTDICESGVCVAHPLTGPTCNEDGNDCTRNECKDGVCEITELTGSVCTVDDNECTRDRCVDGECVARKLTQTRCGPLESFCMDDICIEGTCGDPRTGLDCNADDNICTSDICSAAGECEATPRGTGASCDDGQQCTGYLVCDDSSTCGPAGGLVPCPAEDCKDVTCTEGDPGEYPICEATNLTGKSCDNGLFCDGEETCHDGVCEAGAAACLDLNPSECQTITCDEVDQCQLVQHEDDTPCADGNLCDGNEICMDGTCSPGVAACETSNDCVAQECTDLGDSVVCGDILIEPDGTHCAANNSCFGTGNQMCLDGVCTHGENPVCTPADNDGSFCTKYYQCIPETEGPDCKFLDTQDTPLIEDILTCELSGEGEDNSFHPFSTGFANNEVGDYQGCGNDFSGGEVGYLVSVSPGASFTVNVQATHTTVSGEKLYLFHVIDPCSTTETSCAAFGQGTVSSVADDEGIAFIVIDGLGGNRGKGTIYLDCSP